MTDTLGLLEFDTNLIHITNCKNNPSCIGIVNFEKIFRCMVDMIYNFGRGFATSLALLLVKQVVTPPSGEENDVLGSRHEVCM